MKNDKRINRLAASSNTIMYDSENSEKYIDGAPHVKHESLKKLYRNIIISSYKYSTKYYVMPRVLDIGSGNGSATLSFLEMGAKVTAIDISKTQLEYLKEKCRKHDKRLEIKCGDVFDVIDQISNSGNKYDIIIANSFLHHVPDFLSLIRNSTKILSEYGQFISFQDPLRYDTLNRVTVILNKISYFSWRIFKGDVVNGIKRRIRRSRGNYLVNSVEDNMEYHVIRNGVDHEAICVILEREGFVVEMLKYFSTQSRFWQFVCEKLRIKNTFSIIARRDNRL